MGVCTGGINSEMIGRLIEMDPIVDVVVVGEERERNEAE